MLRSLNVVMIAGLLVAAGCGGQPAPPPAANAGTPKEANPSSRPASNARRPDDSLQPQPQIDRNVAPATAPSDAAVEATASSVEKDAPSPQPEVPALDEQRIADAGIHKLTGEHLTLYTDLPIDNAVEELVTAFDQAYPQWCNYFRISPDKQQSWHVVGCVIVDKNRFYEVDLLPRDLPPFLHAYFSGRRFWVYEQASPYYRRHLLLHEGTHAFMDMVLGSCGPPWYMEGIAELLATHQLVDGQLELNAFPANADQVPGWGRVRLVHDAIAAGRRLKIDEVLAYSGRAHVETEPYGWCWAAAAFLDGHPRYRERFRQLPQYVSDNDFNRRVIAEFRDDWNQLGEEWQLFASQLDYGYDLAREAIDFRTGSVLTSAGEQVAIAADRGWQSTGITLEAGKTYRLTATGRYQVAAEPQPWLTGPAGVTIRYWQGQPLGVLLAAVHPEPCDGSRDSAFLTPWVIGDGALLKPTTSGTLYLRVNDSPAELADNAGQVDVRVEEE